MDYDSLLRRRSPLWVREATTRALHGIALKMNHGRTLFELSDPQEWLWDAIISELEWRNAHPLEFGLRCSCYLCVSPFEALED